jgi:RNase H-like domain found in reverse transcriptase/Reverse transcriptase (RNA-dependent DNA polymerase)/Integrase zinc binding domain/Chromo (CHRromatin Organisation MOdifier) domain/Integrase core domain
MRTGDYLRTMGQLNVLDSEPENVEIALDTCAEIDTIDVKFARQRGLKPYIKDYPRLWQSAGNVQHQAKGAYWATWRMVDDRGVTRTYRRPFLAVDKGPEDAPLLLGERTLGEIGVHISLRAREAGGNQWQFHLANDDDIQRLVKVESAKAFRKRLMKGPKVYGLIEVNSLLSYRGKDNATRLPEALKGYADVFSPQNAEKLAANREGIDLAIEIQEGQEPPYGPLYPLSQAELEVLRRYLQENLDKGFIRPSKSPAGSPILFVPKKDGTLRLCVDYRGLNKVTVKNRYPLPLMGEILDRVNGATVFSKIDLKDAYYRIRIQPGDEWKTAFRTRYGHYEYLVMPFGLTNAPAAFQAYINQALRGLVDDFCIVYLDDILIFSKTEEEHAEHLRLVCDRLRAAELYAKPSKCQFYQQEMEFLGFIVNKQGVRMDPERVRTISEWKEHPPGSYRDVQVFLGFCNFYRRFIQGYSRITRPLTSLMKGSKDGRKTGEFDKEWGSAQQGAFLRLLSAFETAPLLHHFDPELPIRLETDASKYALSGILSQLFEGRWHPIAFYSRQFKGPELNYGTPDQEMLAIVEAFKHWRHYLEGSKHPVEVLTDHHNLQAFMKQPKLNGRQARWCYYLTPHDFIIRWQSGSTNPADAPSRRPDYRVRDQEDDGHDDPSSGLLATLEAKIARVQQIRTSYRRRVMQSHDEEEPQEKEAKQAHKRDSESARARKPCEYDSESGRQAKQGTCIYDSESGQQEPRSTCEYDSESGRQVLSEWQKTTSGLGLRTPSVTPQGDEVGADHLIRCVLMQKVTRKRARQAVLNEAPRQEPSEGLRQLVAVAQKEDPFCTRVDKDLTVGDSTRPHYSRTSDGMLLYKGRILVPNQRSLVHEILRLHHDEPSAGHWRFQKTLELLQRKFKWEGMRQDVEEYVQTCPVCQGNAASSHKPYGQLDALPQPSRPWKEISMDFITQLPLSRVGMEEYNAILTVVDRYTKMAIFLPVQDTIDAAEMAELLHKEVELRYGCPSGIVSDRDPKITSKFWAEICHYSFIKRKMSTAFHPQTDGQTEILNRVVEGYLRAFTSLEQMNWAKLLPTAAFAYNNSMNHTLRMSPFKALYGFDPEFHVDIADDVPKGEIPAAKDRIQKLHELRRDLREQFIKAQERQIKYYNERHTPKTFKRGSLVKLSTRNLRLRDKKLQPRFIGPFRITEVIGSQAYRLALPQQYSRLHDVFPIQLLEEYYPRDQQEPMPMPELEDDPDEYEVEEIRDKRMIKGKNHYLIKWTGWPSEYNQWVPEDDMNAPKLIQDFEKTRKRRRQRIE